MYDMNKLLDDDNYNADPQQRFVAEMNQFYRPVAYEDDHLASDKIRITYETSWNEPLHPDPSVVARLVEVAIGPCEYGCKIYADPNSKVRILGHNTVYGCRK